MRRTHTYTTIYIGTMNAQEIDIDGVCNCQRKCIHNKLVKRSASPESHLPGLL